MTSAPPKSTNPWLILSILALGLFVTGVSSTSVNTAIPAIGAGLPASFAELLWIVNIYSLVMAILVITAGRLGDLYGPKRIFILGLAVFAAGSVLCGTAATPLMLTAGRLVQGVGAALCSPQSLSVISKIFPPERRGAAMGFWGAVAGGAVAVGPSIGGLLVQAWGWRAVFLVNVPVCLLAAVLAAVLIPEVGGGRRHRLDWLGSGLATAGLFGVSFGLIEGPPHGWGPVAGPVTSPMVIAAGVALLGAFLAVERGRQDREPLLPFVVLRNRNFRLMAGVVISLTAAVGSMLLLLSLYLQSALGLPAATAGLILAIAPAISIAIAPLAGRYTDRLGGRGILVLGLLLFTGGLVQVAAAGSPGARWTALLPGLVLIGVAMGVTFAPPLTIAMHDIPPAVAGAASGTLNTIRMFGVTISSAIVGAVVQDRLVAATTAAAAEQAAGLPEPLRRPLVDSVDRASSGGLTVNGLDLSLPDGITGAPAALLRAAAERAFHLGLADALRLTFLVPAALLTLSIGLTLAVRRSASTGPAGDPVPPSDRTATTLPATAPPSRAVG